MSGLFAELGQGSLFKRLDQVKRGIRPISSGLISDLIDHIPTPTSPIANLFRSAHNGDVLSKVAVDQLGLWEALLIGAYGVEDNIPSPNAHLLAIERACADSLVLVNAGHFHEAVQLLSDDPLMCRFLWPEAITIARTAAKDSQLLSLRASIALEVLLSYVAAWDVDLGMPESQLIDMLPALNMPGCNPDKLLFKWLKIKIGAKSIDSILDDERAHNLSIDTATLKRWSSGKHHPSPEQWEEIIAVFMGKSDYPQAKIRYLGATYLNFIGYFSQRILQSTMNQAGTINSDCLLPWPYFPFGHASIESWCQARYLDWYDYHKIKAGNGDNK